MKNKTLSIIIPVYNEEKTIQKILQKVLDVKVPVKKEIIIVDDGSTDSTAEKIRQFISNHQEIQHFHKKNTGKGSAIRYGFEKAKGDIFVIQDADLEYDPNEFNKLLNPILQEGYKVVYGSRYLSEKGHLKEHHGLTFKIHKFGNKILSLITSLLYGVQISDMETCYKMFTREVYENIKLTADDFSIEPEITAKIIKKGYKIKEVPINYFSRDYAEGKKITWTDGIKALISLIKWRIIK